MNTGWIYQNNKMEIIYLYLLYDEGLSKQRIKVITMSDRKLMLKQIDITLKQEKIYLEKFDKQLKNPNSLDDDKERIIMFRQACLAAIDRCKKARLKYGEDAIENSEYISEKGQVQE
jgi:hypothetical protein